ncbi:hypothetical protein HYR99_02585 [Candidatus Poribacteria bacterium]|nr:hypothetical protein [Candidatus Poribacteria bacterium]
MKARRTIRVRHYTRKNSADKIMQERRILAQSQNRVFVEKATRKPLSPKAAELKYGLRPGKGSAIIEFDVDMTELKSKPNPIIKPGEEYYLQGDVDLTHRNPERVR